MQRQNFVQRETISPSITRLYIMWTNVYSENETIPYNWGKYRRWYCTFLKQHYKYFEKVALILVKISPQRNPILLQKLLYPEQIFISDSYWALAIV